MTMFSFASVKKMVFANSFGKILSIFKSVPNFIKLSRTVQMYSHIHIVHMFL